MITTKEVKVKIHPECSSEYIEDELNKIGFDILRWAITDADEEFYTVNIAILQNT